MAVRVVWCGVILKGDTASVPFSYLPSRRRRHRVRSRHRRQLVPMSVTLHTDLGTLKLEVYCDIVPRTSFNFLALAASGYYDNTLFHRNIKGFMLQGGDPTGTGKGGESIWGGKFNDEIHPDNKHTVRGVVSMANSGPNTNGSQFFITYAKHPHLDNNCAPPAPPPPPATPQSPRPPPSRRPSSLRP